MAGKQENCRTLKCQLRAVGEVRAVRLSKAPLLRMEPDGPPYDALQPPPPPEGHAAYLRHQSLGLVISSELPLEGHFMTHDPLESA